MSEWDCDETLLDKDFVFGDDEDAESYASYGEEEDYEEEGEEFTEEEYEEDDLAPALPILSRFTPPAPPKRGAGGIIRDPNAPVPKPMENCPIPFDGWDTTVTRDDGVHVISKKNAVSDVTPNTGSNESLTSNKEVPLIPNTAQDHAVQEQSGGIENSSSGSNTVKSGTDDDIQISGEESDDAAEANSASNLNNILHGVNENCTSQNNSNENKEQEENNENEAVPDPNENSAAQNPDENGASQNDLSESSGDEESTENSGIQEPTEASASQGPDDNNSVQDENENGTSQNDSDKGSGDEEPSTNENDADTDGPVNILSESEKSEETAAKGDMTWPKLVALLHAVFIVLCAVWFACAASPRRYNPKWGFPMLRRMDLSGQTAIVTGANRGIYIIYMYV